MDTAANDPPLMMNRARCHAEIRRPDGRRLQVTLLTADVRIPRRQLRPDERADERHRPTERPHEQNQHRIGDDARDVGRVREDADADDAASDDDDRVEEAELAAEPRSRCGGAHDANAKPAKASSLDRLGMSALGKPAEPAHGELVEP
jgi:hypothetical protein